MATKITNLSPSHLASLSANSTKIDIRWQANSESQSFLLYGAFPKKVAVAFSGKWRAQFNPVVALSSTEVLRKASFTTVAVVGGQSEAFEEILKWMLSCCDGQGLKEFPSSRRLVERSFCRYVGLRDAATQLAIPHLVKVFTTRLQKIMEVQVHTEDIRALYADLPREHEILKWVANDIGERMINVDGKKKSLKGIQALYALRVECPEFGEDVEAVVQEERKRMVEEEEEAAKTAASTSVDVADGVVEDEATEKGASADGGVEESVVEKCKQETGLPKTFGQQTKKKLVLRSGRS